MVRRSACGPLEPGSNTDTDNLLEGLNMPATNVIDQPDFVCTGCESQCVRRQPASKRNNKLKQLKNKFINCSDIYYFSY